jgi:hypothetical protein
MYQEILTPRSIPVITPLQLAAFGRFDLPQENDADYELLLMMIEAATDEVESMAAQACLTEEILLTFDFFPGQADPRQEMMALNYAYATNLWWYGFPTLDSIELVRRPVIVPNGGEDSNLSITYNDINGTVQTLDPSNYQVFADKITLSVGQAWPLTDRRQDCVQITYNAGYSEGDPTQVPARLRMAILYLANHMHDVRQIITVEPTSEVGFTLCRMLRSYRSMRLPR